MGGGTKTDVSEGSSAECERSSGEDSVPVSPVGGEAAVRPWSCARAKFVVKPATAFSGEQGRMKQLKRDKVAVMEMLPRTPYIRVSWRESHRPRMRWKDMIPLVDTGADWSLIAESELSVSELVDLQPSDVQGQAVTKDQIEVVGEVWRDVRIGTRHVTKQRFIVLKDMVTNTILGADFWIRLGELTIDFKNKQVRVASLGLEIDLLDSTWERTTQEGQLLVVSKEEVHVPPFSQMIVQAKVVGGSVNDGEELFVEPVAEEGDLCCVPYTVCSIKGDSVFLKVANLGMDDAILESNKLLGTGSRSFDTRKLATQGKDTDKGKPLDIQAMCGKQLSEGKRGQLVQLLNRYKDIFYTEGQLPVVKIGVEHSIRVKGDTAPIAYRPRRLSPEEEKEVKEEIQQLLDMGVVRQSNSPWAAPIVCARKASGKLRLAIDFRGLNGVSLPATLHPIPRIDDLFDRLGEAKYFSILDAKSGYHQLPLAEGEAEMTAFVVPWGQFEFIDRTPFGLKGAGYSFQRFMSTLLGECNFRDALCYLDDILVWGKTWEEHCERLGRVLDKVRQAGLMLGPSKCSFGVETVQYLGSTIRNGMLSISEQRVKSLRELPRPQTIKGLRSALGAFSFVQRWIPGMAEINKPLYAAISDEKRKKLVWSKEMVGAFEKLKTLTANAVALQIPNMEQEFILVTDGSDTGIGSMLAQLDSAGEMIPVAFYHHALTKAQQKYCTTDKELLAVFLSIQKFRVYLGKPFKLITDHSAVRYMKTIDANDEKGRRGRWIEYLQQFEMELIQRSGNSKELSVADYLSRVTKTGAVKGVAVVKISDEGQISVNGFLDVEEIKTAQESDEEVTGWKKMLKENRSEGTAYKFLDSMVVDSQGLLRVIHAEGKKEVKTVWGNSERYKVVVPVSLRKKVIEFVHNSPTAGHMGVRRTYKRCRDSFWWPDMTKDVTQFVGNCELCGKNKHMTHPNVAPLQIMDIPDVVFDKLQVDFLGPFPVSTAHDYRYALQVQDILSRFLILVPTEKDNATTAANVVFEDWVCKFGPPKIIQSDRGTHFASKVFEGLCELAGIKHRMGAPSHAESQGQVERQNQLMMQVRCLAENKVDGWPSAMVRIAYTHNTSINETTRLTPYQVVFATKPRTMERVLLDVDGKENSIGNKGVNGYHTLLKATKEETQLKAKDATVAAQKERSWNSCRRGDQFGIGDHVRIQLSVAERGKLGGKKVAPVYSDVYVVREVKGDGWTYLLDPINKKLSSKIRHFNNLKLVERAPSAEDEEVIEVRMDLSQKNDNMVRPRTAGKEPKEPDKMAVQEPRRSKRTISAPKRMQMTLDGSGKRYTETSVPLTEDEVGEGGEEQC